MQVYYKAAQILRQVLLTYMLAFGAKLALDDLSLFTFNLTFNHQYHRERHHHHASRSDNHRRWQVQEDVRHQRRSALSFCPAAGKAACNFFSKTSGENTRSLYESHVRVFLARAIAT